MAWKNTSWCGWTPILAGISYSFRPWATKAARVRRRMSCSVTPAAITSSWVRYHTSLPMLILLGNLPAVLLHVQGVTLLVRCLGCSIRDPCHDVSLASAGT